MNKLNQLSRHYPELFDTDRSRRIKITPSNVKIRRMPSIDYWDLANLNLEDELNSEMWRESPTIQKRIQSPEDLKQPGSIGAQQAMLEGDAASEVLPWVPDLVGRRAYQEGSVLVIGPHYSGFIRGYSRRRETLSLIEYQGAQSPADFLRLFVDKVVRFDETYYRGLETLLRDLVDPKDVVVSDLCRASFVRRGKGTTSRRDESSENVVHDGWGDYTKYIENEFPRAWTLRRVRESNTRLIVAVGAIAEHGFLRLLAKEGSQVEDYVSGEKLNLQYVGLNWTARPADPDRDLDYWYSKGSFWQTQLSGQRLFVLPVLQPFTVGEHDPHYERTRAVLLKILRTAYPRTDRYTHGANLLLNRYRTLRDTKQNSEYFAAQDLITGRLVLLKSRIPGEQVDLGDAYPLHLVDREIQMLSLLNRPEFLLCTDYGREGRREIAAYEYHPDARRLSAILIDPHADETRLVGPDARFDIQIRFLRTLAEALNAMHSLGIVHGAIDPDAVWVWPVAGLWISKLSRLDMAAANAVSPVRSPSIQGKDILSFAKLARLLLEKTARSERDDRWQQVDRVVSEIEQGAAFDAGMLLDAIASPQPQVGDLLKAFLDVHKAAPQKAGEPAIKLVQVALREESTSALPPEVLAYIVKSDPALLNQIITRLLTERPERRDALMRELLVELGASGDIDSEFEPIVCELLAWRPPKPNYSLLDLVYEFGDLFLKAHPRTEIQETLPSFCGFAFSLASLPEAKQCWISRLRKCAPAVARDLEIKHRKELPADLGPPNCRSHGDPKKIVGEGEQSHVNYERLVGWARKVYSRYPFVYDLRREFKKSGRTFVGEPKLTSSRTQVQTPLIPVHLGEQYTKKSGQSIQINVIFAPETTLNQLNVAKRIFCLKEAADLFPQVNSST